MKTKKFYLLNILLLIFLTAYVRSDTSYGESNIFTLDTRSTSVQGLLSQLTAGPSTSSVSVPANGTGYYYVQFTSNGNKKEYSGEINVSMQKSGGGSVSAAGLMLAPGLLRVAVPYSALGGASQASFTFPSSIIIGDSTFYVPDSSITFSASKSDKQYTRTWNIFAGGSAGVSGMAGGVDAETSVSAAKLSISGECGGGLILSLDRENSLTIERRMEAGTGAELEAPPVNAAAGEVNVKGSVSFMVKTQTGESFCFSDLNLSEDQKKMAKAGLMLETLSLAGAGLSPTAGIFIKAAVNTMNSTGGVSHYFDLAKVNSYWGLGAEGKFGAGGSLELGESLSLTGTEISGGAAVQARSIKTYSNGSESGSSIRVSLGASYNFPALSMSGFPFADKIGLTEDNLTLFDGGKGGEVTLAADKSIGGTVESFTVNLSGGGDAVLSGSDRNRYFDTEMIFPKEYINAIKLGSTALAGIIMEEKGVKLNPEDMAQDALNVLDETVESLGGTPVSLTTYETRGKGYVFKEGFNLDAAFGVGLGLSIGVKAHLFDEIRFPRKVTEVYTGRHNYLLSSAEYTSDMESAELKNVMNDLFSGTVPLIKESFKNLLNISENAVSAGQEAVSQVKSASQEKVGEICGAVNQAGKWITSAYSPNSSRVIQKPFSTPRVKSMYYVKEVLHKKYNARAGTQTLKAAKTVLVIVSDAMNIGFIPDGETQTLETLSQDVELKMIVFEDKLLENNFPASDKKNVEIYFYDPDSVSWINEGGSVKKDTVKAKISRMGTYALGIELKHIRDRTPPEIYEKGPDQGVIYDSSPEIYAKIRDDNFGDGIDLSRTFLMLNGDTLNTSYDPANEKIYYQFSSEDTLMDGEYTVTVEVTDFADNTVTQTFTFTLDPMPGMVGIENDSPAPGRFRVYQNYPNPFNPETNIQFDLPFSGTVEVNVYDLRGSFIRQLITGNKPAGRHEVTWDGRNGNGSPVSSGTYFYQVKFKNKNVVKKMNLLK